MIIVALTIDVGAIEVDIGNSKCNVRIREAEAGAALVVAVGVVLVATAEVRVGVSLVVALAAVTMTAVKIRNHAVIAMRGIVLIKKIVTAFLAQLCIGDRKRTKLLSQNLCL